MFSSTWELFSLGYAGMKLLDHIVYESSIAKVMPDCFAKCLYPLAVLKESCVDSHPLKCIVRTLIFYQMGVQWHFTMFLISIFNDNEHLFFSLQMYSPIQSGLPQRQTESAGIFLWHPSANQKNNSRLFKVYQWMQNILTKAEVTFSREVPKSHSHRVLPTKLRLLSE